MVMTSMTMWTRRAQWAGLMTSDLSNESPTAPKKENGPLKISTWLDGFPPIMPMDHLLRDPLWEGAWEVVLMGM
jgi:hypothetical protein